MMRLVFFRRSLLVWLAAAVGVAVPASLGMWQLGRAETKQQLQAVVVARANLPELPADQALSVGPSDAEAFWHRRVTLVGTWLADQTVFLDNRTMNRRQGFYVLTPLKEAATQRLVWVQRGWAPRNFSDRTALPTVATPGGTVVAQGRMAPPPSRVYEPGPSEAGVIRQNLDMEAWALQTGWSVSPWVLVQTHPDPSHPNDGLARDWPVPDAGVHKHWGYAVQWFSLSALFAGLFIWFQFISPRRRDSPSSSN